MSWCGYLFYSFKIIYFAHSKLIPSVNSLAMIKYWESRFKNEGAMWKFEPSDSAIQTLKLFKLNKFQHILIPGFGYGRNAKLFIDNGFKVTGIEISKSAIDLARENGLTCLIHHGSVTSMPFDHEQYDGIFCYAMIHLLNKNDRKHFLQSCSNQLNPGGMMVFVVASTTMSLFGTGKYLSKNRYQISTGLKTYFYDRAAILNEFSEIGLIEYTEIEEPIKFMDGQEPIKLFYVVCKK
jgi:SAM-dependent methyltransferase